MMLPGARQIPDPEAEVARLAAKRQAATDIHQARAEFLAASEARKRAARTRQDAHQCP